jgi:hypothetical protein
MNIVTMQFGTAKPRRIILKAFLLPHLHLGPTIQAEHELV